MTYAATDKDASHEDDDDDEREGGRNRGGNATRQSGDSDKLAARLANKQNNF